MGTYLGFIQRESRQYFDAGYGREHYTHPALMLVARHWNSKHPLGCVVIAEILSDLMRFAWPNHAVEMVGDDWTGSGAAPYYEGGESGWHDALLCHQPLIIECVRRHQSRVLECVRRGRCGEITGG